MIDLSGIWYRVYAEVPLIFLTGVIIFAFDIALGVVIKKIIY